VPPVERRQRRFGWALCFLVALGDIDGDIRLVGIEKAARKGRDQREAAMTPARRRNDDVTPRRPLSWDPPPPVLDSPRPLFITDGARAARSEQRTTTMLDYTVDEADIDPVTGSVKDGGRVRVRMPQMSDAAPPTGTRAARRAARRQASASTVDAAVVAQTLAALATQDAVAREAISAASHRPGFRCFTEDAGVDLYAGERARAERIVQDGNAWRGDAPAVQNLPPRSMSAADGQAIKDTAWLEMVERVSNEWRT
jgi:hypothetical protein